MNTALNGILDPAALTPERIVHWLVAPLFPEQVDDLMIPLLLGDVPLVLAFRGLVLPSTLEDGTDLLVEGHTGKMNSKFYIRRRGNEWRTSGHREDHEVDFAVNFGGEQVTVHGKTGHFHADCAITVGETSLQVKGLLGGDHCDYQVSLGASNVKVQGTEHSENVHFDIVTGDTGWIWKGEAAEDYIDLSLTAVDSKLQINGHLYGHQCMFHIDPREDGLYLEGFTNWGPLHFTLKPIDNGYAVHGRSDENHLDYKVTRSSLPKEC